MLRDVLFRAIAFGFFFYWRIQQAIVPSVDGIALFVFPYFI